MKIVYIGPPGIDDATAHRAMKARVEIANRMRIGETRVPGVFGDPKAVKRYRGFLESLTKKNNSKISSVASVVPELYGIKETEILDGSWLGIRAFHDRHLEELRTALWSSYFPGFESNDPSRNPDMYGTREYGQVLDVLQKDQITTLVHVDMGASLATLYAAYFAVQDGIPIAVTFHRPDDPEGPFGIGGFSSYAIKHPYIRRRLLLTVLRHSQFIFVPNQGIGTALSTLASNLELGFFIDPFLDEPSEQPSEEPISK